MLIRELNDAGIAQIVREFIGIPLEKVIIPKQWAGMIFRLTTDADESILLQITDPRTYLADIVYHGRVEHRSNGFRGTIFLGYELCIGAQPNCFETNSPITKIERIDSVTE